MTTLTEIHDEIFNQLQRDYTGTNPSILKDLFIIGLTEEVGEVAGLRKRELRHNFRDTEILKNVNEKYKEELGDVLWYLIACCILNGYTLEDIWQYNKTKLAKRYKEVKESWEI